MAETAAEFDVIVIGAGIMGSCAAYQTTKRGQTTLLLEQFDFLHHRGSSHGESRTIRAAYAEPHYAAMVVESSRLWEQAQSEIGYRVYYKTRHLDLGPSANNFLHEVIHSCRSNSVAARPLDHLQTAEEFSGRIQLPDDWAAVVTDLGGVLRPTKAVSMFQSLAFRRGAVLRDNVKVSAIARRGGDGGVLVSAASGETFSGKKCVVTAGAWTKELLESAAGIEIPIQPLQTSVCYWRIKEGFEKDYTIEGGFPTFASCGHPYIYGTPSLEFPGLIKVALHGGESCDPDRRTWVLGSGLSGSVDQLREWVQRRLAGRVEADGPVLTQSCMYSMTPDEDFVIDFLGGIFGKDVVVAGGFSGHGFKMGPVVGKILADLVIDGETHGVEMKHFGLGRFKDNPRGNVKGFVDQVSSCDR
ncbi:hypothetical protein Dimus_002534 [Dionaea muscipula]